VEGLTDDEVLERARYRRLRNLLATVLLAQGVPMICAGDEMGRTQQGNNNAYCQDNETSWVDWSLTALQQRLLDFTRAVVAVRHAHQVLRRRRYFVGRGYNGGKDLLWLDAHGHEMHADTWGHADLQVVGMRVSATLVDERTGATEPIEHDVLLALFNAGEAAVPFTLPQTEGVWSVLFDTADDGGRANATMQYRSGQRYALAGQSVALLRVDHPAAAAAPAARRDRRRPRRRASDFRR
jgi:isoamylase